MRLSLVGGSIRRALLIVVAVSALPSLGIILLTGMEARRHAMQDAAAAALELASSIAAEQVKKASDIRQLLHVLAHIPGILETASGPSEVFLANLLNSTPHLAGICRANASGQITGCVSGSIALPLTEAPLASKAIKNRAFTPGAYVSPGGVEPLSLAFAYPLLQEDALTPDGALIAHVRLEAFTDGIGTVDQPDGSVAAMLDRHGRPMCRVPPENWAATGSSAPGPIWERISGSGGKGTFVDRGNDGLEMIFAHIPLRLSPDGDPYLHVLVGFPESAAMADANRMLHRNLALLASATLMALLIGWLLWKPLLGRRVNRLVEVTGKLGAGEFSARIGDPAGSGELSLLERSVDALAQSLAESAQKQQLYEAALRKTGEELDAKVRERTAQLSEINRLLKSEMVERAKAQIETARSEARYRALYEQSAAGVILLDTAGTVKDANPSALALLGYSLEEIRGMRYPDIIQKDNLERTPTRLDEVLAGGSLLLDRIYLSKTGTEIPAQAACGRVDGNTLQVVFTDSTERKRYEKLRDDIERITRHDLKTPLMGMVQVPDLLLRSDNLTRKQREFLQMLRESGYRMLHTINMSTVLYKMEANQYECDRVDFDMLATVKLCARELAHMGKSKGVSIAVKLDGRLPGSSESFVVNGEELLCVTMLENLLKNAMEAAPPETEVSIELSAMERAMTIRNKGEVPKGIRDRFFEKYSTEGKKWGTGLGTYSARLIAESHGWTIRLDSSIPGETSIVLAFPPVDAVTRNRAA